MHTAETVDAGLLRRAAEQKNDESVLHYIRGKDCVAIEVHYHTSCYKSYTQFLYKRSPRQGHLYLNAYEKFCQDVIVEKMIQKHNVYRMTKLFQKFLHYVNMVEEKDASNYKASRLKTRLKVDYPQLVFFAPSKCTQSELVYVEAVSAGEVLDNLPDSASNSGSEYELYDEEDNQQTNCQQQSSFQVENNMHLLYSGAMLLQTLIKGAPEFDAPWPPTSYDITLESARKMVPIPLYNFLAWVLGMTDDPGFDDYAKVTGEENAKLLSLAQDIIYVSHAGRKPTPKHLALSMTIRQMTGSSGLLKVIHGFGHCASHSTTLRHDTALAELNLQSSTVVPKEILPNKHTTLIWDNDDFQEESKSSTHITNGIAVQRALNEDVITIPPLVKTRRKSLDDPCCELMPYSIGKKKSIDVLEQCSDLEFEEECHSTHQISANKLDLVYCLLKLSFIDNSELLPDWTGFNTLLSRNDTSALNLSRIGYLPVIEGSPTQYTTVYTVFVKSLEIAAKLNLEYVVLVFDEAIYAKAQQIRWKNESFMVKTILRLGDFHAVMSFCGAISRIFQDAGLRVCIL